MRSAAWLKNLIPFIGVATRQADVSSHWDPTVDDQTVVSNDDDEDTQQQQVSAPSATTTTTGVAKPEEEAAGAVDLEESLNATDAVVAEIEATEKDASNADASSAAVDKFTFARTIPFPEIQPTQARIGISACLMGHEVRYNGGHCNARNMMDTLAKEFQFVPVCPEMDIGLGVPRATLRLVSELGTPLTYDMDLEDLAGHVSLYCPDKDTNYTAQMTQYAKEKAMDLQAYGCDGFILKAQSPSCGLHRVKLYQGYGETANGRKIYQGMFAKILVTEWPELPVIEEGMMQDQDMRNAFIQQVSCHSRWRQLDGSFNSVVKFHETHKYILMAQDPNALKNLGHILAKGPKYFNANDVRKLYYRTFFIAMKVLVSRGRHVNVLSHLAGYLRRDMKAGGFEEMYQGLIGSIDEYKDGLVPLVVPLRLLQLLAQTLEVEKQATKKELDANYVPPSTKDLLLASEYIKGAPRSLKAHTVISKRYSSKIPGGVLPAGVAPAGSEEAPV